MEACETIRKHVDWGSYGEADSTGSGRRRQRSGSSRTGPAPKIRIRLPGHACGQRPGRPRYAGTAEIAAGPSRLAPERPAYARNERRGVLVAWERDVSGSQTGAVDGLRRYRGGNPGHQYGENSLLPEQALGPTGRAPISGPE